MTTTESNKIRKERQLEALDATLSAVKIARKWLDDYYPALPYLDSIEEQSLQELKIHLDKSEQVIRNYVHTLLPLKENNE